LLTELSIQACDSSSYGRAKDELKNATDLLLSGKFDADFALYKQWTLPGVQALVERIRSGSLATYQSLVRIERDKEGAEKKLLTSASKFFGQATQKSKNKEKEAALLSPGKTSSLPHDLVHATISALFISSFSHLPPVHIALIHSVEDLVNLRLAALLSTHNLVMHVICLSVSEMLNIMVHMLDHNFSHFDTVFVNLGSNFVESKDTKPGTLRQNVLFILVFLSPGYKGQMSTSPPDTVKKGDQCLWKGTFARQRGSDLSKYPGHKHQRFVLDSSFFVRLFKTFHPSSVPHSETLTVLEVPESHCSGLLAAVQSGFGYLGFQQQPNVLKWLLTDGINAIKKEVSEDKWTAWFSMSKALAAHFQKPKKRKTEQASSSSSKRKKPVPSESEEKNESSESSESFESSESSS
jgi:hypothetical protein